MEESETSDPFSSGKPPFLVSPLFEMFYLISLEFCTYSAMASVERLNGWIQRKDSGDDAFPPQLPLNEVQNIVNQCAAVSRYFWPSDNKYKARGEALRRAFNIEDSSPLKERKMRNMVEHFDEYLDVYLSKNFAGQYVPDYFGISPDDDRGPLKLFRAFFVNTSQFEVFGETFEMIPLVEALVDLHEQLIKAHENGSRFPLTQKTNEE